jgi:hypothetical protein
MATLKNLGGKAFILATQIKNANSWDEMQSLFRDWFAKGDKTNNALFFETLVWSKEMPIARFGQMFKSAVSRADKEIRREEYSFIADWRLGNEDSYVTYIVGWELN